jgi:hypothetical protein
MPRELKIIPVLNGWIVEAGCQRCVFGDLGQLYTALGDYYRDPEATEARFLKDAKNKILPPPGLPVAPPATEDRAPTPDEQRQIQRLRAMQQDPNIGSIPQEIRR